MPIDARIPLLAQAPQMPDLMDVYTKAQQLQNAKQQGQLQGLQLEQGRHALDQLRQSLQDEKAARDIIARHGDDIDAARSELYQELGPNAVKIITDMTNQRQVFAGMQEKDIELAKKRIGVFASTVHGIGNVEPEKRQEAYEQALDFLVKNGLLQQDAIGQSIPKEYPGDDVIGMISQSMTSVEKQIKQQESRLRAEWYARNIESTITARGAKTAADFERLENDIRETQRRIEADDRLDERERQRLIADMQKHRDNIARQAEEEHGRNRRFDEGEKGRMDRLRTQQQFINDRMEKASRSNIAPSEVISVVNNALKAMGRNSLNELEEDEVLYFQGMVDSALMMQRPEFGTKTVPRFILPDRTRTTVTPGQNLNQAPGVFPQGQAPQSFQPTGQSMNLPPLSPGKVYVSGPDGEGLFELPEAQLNDYLKANPKAKAYRAE
jgi:hypothetical protein